ncbi:hypothetical protein LPB72_08295 [Hydrogenophaga crassostreae]|uniref:Calcineurin-like phosphoesterase domain-containing protein n=1 Tax=Hydrogenophaga crassostreae TaxID=1763535 RepID=A0A167IBT0_9BURK|nr:metallophosphoesterase [Hydrogenophaga crassostreae]AOW12428.1 hypothetical protein LPB072_05715 [Hydrogenophaga crassostreae]OAD42479.1 hypothetical protein LPB72_08295 [Hydrogenophaga crassostreae]
MLSSRTIEFWSWRLFAVALVVSLGVSWWDYPQRWHTPGYWLRNLIMYWLYWSPRLAGVFMLTGFVSRAWNTRGGRRLLAMLMSVGVMIGLWSSLVEPQQLQVRETVLTGLPEGAEPVRLAVISDVHWGLFFRDSQLQGLVDKLNTLEVDAVLVAGDWTHEPPLDLKTGLAPLASIRHPVYGVMGNHDVEAPGPPLTEALREALKANGVQMLEGRMVTWKGWELVGLDDQWGGSPGPQVAALWPNERGHDRPQPSRRIVLAHQPDTLALLPEQGAFLAIAGHTHGGQIWIPGLTPWWLRNTNSEQSWWNGLYSTRVGPVFVTPGVGTVGLPARLAVPPMIDVIELR